ncbi:MAG: heme exporter protein CcmB [Alphaproteobacteria bacterium]
MLRPALALLRRDLLLAWRQRGGAVPVLGTFVLMVVIFPLALGPDPTLLARIGPAIIWVAALLATTITLDHIFASDHADGSLDLLVQSPAPLATHALAKATAHWLVSGLPMVAFAPLMALMLNLPGHVYGPLVLGLLLGTPTLTLIGTVGGALILGARRGGLLLVLLVVPLYVPVLIFGAGAADAAMSGLDAAPALMFLGALLLIGLALCPWAAAAAVRAALT